MEFIKIDIIYIATTHMKIYRILDSIPSPDSGCVPTALLVKNEH